MISTGISVANGGYALCGWYQKVRGVVCTAMKLLRHTDHSIEQIARECGFGDRYYLTRIFTKHRQTTPAALRKEARA